MIIAERTLRENHPSTSWPGMPPEGAHKMGLWKRLAGGRGASTLTRPDVEGERGTRERGAAFERFSFAVEGLSEVRDVLRRRGLSWVLLIALALNLIAAALVLSFERDMPGSNINSYPDALWWAVTTITTVGYGDRFPMSPAGRGVAVVLMVSGIALFGIITASIAAYFVVHNAEQDDLAGRLDRILEWLDTIEAGLRVDEREDQWSHDSAPARSQPTRLN